MRNDAVVVPLRRQAPSNASADPVNAPQDTEPASASASGASNPLYSIDPDLADTTAAGAAMARGKGEQKKGEQKKGAGGKPGLLENGDAPPSPVAKGGWIEEQGVLGVPVVEAFANATANSSLSDALNPQAGKGKVSAPFAQPGEPAVRRVEWRDAE